MISIFDILCQKLIQIRWKADLVFLCKIIKQIMKHRLYPQIRLHGIKSKATSISSPFNLHCQAIAALLFIPYCRPIWRYCRLDRHLRAPPADQVQSHPYQLPPILIRFQAWLSFLPWQGMYPSPLLIPLSTTHSKPAILSLKNGKLIGKNLNRLIRILLHFLQQTINHVVAGLCVRVQSKTR